MNKIYIISGGPCSGKTTTMIALKKLGYKVYFETARKYIEEQLKKGLTMDEIRKDNVKLQRAILRRKIDLENKLSGDRIIFLERGIPDSIAYFKLSGAEDDPELQAASKKSKYKKIFHFDLLDYKTDVVRSEDKKEAELLDRWNYESYKDLGFDIVRVSVMPVEKRVKFILSNL